MIPKPINQLRARLIEGEVRLSAYKNLFAYPDDPAREAGFRAVRVLRQRTDGFTFGKDRDEYFHGTTADQAELLFHGALEAHRDRKFTWIDRDVEPGHTYAYWMGADDGPLTGPVAVRVRDPEVWWSYDRLRQELDSLREAFPALVRLEVLGHSVQQREIVGLRIGTTAPSIGLVGLIHAGESGPELMVPAIRRLLAEQPELLARVGLIAIPSVNVDQRESAVQGTPWYLRTNANGVDLNRNFPVDWETVEYGYGLDTSDPDSVTYRGLRPASEPETQAVMACMQEMRPRVVYAYHCLSSICGCRFVAPRRGGDDQPFADRARELALCYGQPILPEATLDAETTVGFGASSGSLPAWLHTLDIPAFDLEIDNEREPEALRLCQQDLTDRQLLYDYQQRHHDGLAAVLARFGDD